ncbi:MAG: glucoamylase family protein, partial [Gemmatimonadaceae bacterium]
MSAPNGDLRADPFLDTLEQRTFRWFWETTNASNGLTPDRWPTRSFSSVASVGFALTAYGIGVERGYVTRAEAAQRTLTTLRFFWEAPQGEQAAGVTGYRGFFYHFLDMQSGHRFQQVE